MRNMCPAKERNKHREKQNRMELGKEFRMANSKMSILLYVQCTKSRHNKDKTAQRNSQILNNKKLKKFGMNLNNNLPYRNDLEKDKTTFAFHLNKIQQTNIKPCYSTCWPNGAG